MDTDKPPREGGQAKRLGVVGGNPAAPSKAERLKRWIRPKSAEPPLVKAAVMRSRRADVAPLDVASRIGSGVPFTSSEVSDLLGIPEHVLRYWEAEFPMLAPQKAKTGQRIYRRSDVETIVRIRELLYDERLTLVAARAKLEEELHRP